MIQLRQVIQAVFESVCDAVAVLAQIAQSVEQRTENPRVTGSIPVLGICGCSSMVEHQPSKLDTWVRFPSPAFAEQKRGYSSARSKSGGTYLQQSEAKNIHLISIRASGSAVEHNLAKVGVAGSIPVSRLKKKDHPFG